jgi:LacI family transcriptional regulator
MDSTLKKEKRANIYDVAREAGSSPATVSRVLNNNGYPVKEEIREKILLAAKKLDYTPNALGRMLKSNQTKVIGVIVPTIVNPFYSQIVLGIETEAKKSDYGVLLCNTARDPAEEAKYLQSLFDKQVMGIALSSVTENYDLIKVLQRKGLKVVFIDQDAADVECGKIGFNYIKCGIIAAEYLISSGHRNMAYFTSPLVKRNRVERLEGFRTGLAMHGLTLDPSNVYVDELENDHTNSNYEFECGKRLAARMLESENRPTAIFTANDMIAVGVLQQLADSGVAVPDEISVIGFDNIHIASVVNPPLTTIDQPSMDIGRFACHMLIDMLEGSSSVGAMVTLEPTLVERRSVRQLV